jgi:mono/diheme cytochrome c family protein
MSRLTLLVVLSSFIALAGPPATVDKALLDKGKSVFTVNCLPCHGEKGEGNGPAAAALNPKPRNFTADAFKQGETPDAVFKTISGGIPNTQMVSFAYLPEADRWALANWVLELRKAGKPVAAPGAKK